MSGRKSPGAVAAVTYTIGEVCTVARTGKIVLCMAINDD